MKKKAGGLAAALAAVVATAFALASAPEAAAGDPKESAEDPWLFFVPGNFVLVGQAPNAGATYAGQASIAEKGGRFQLRRTIAGKTVEAEGKIEVPSPPGEGKVLRFRWKEGDQKKIMTCLVSTDLDNYARLSCLWGEEGSSPDQPGLEAYFSRDGWGG